MTSEALVEAPVVREVEIPGCSEKDYHAARLWCSECAVEPWTEVRCGGCSQTHRHPNFGPYLTCNVCGSDLVWVVFDRATKREATSLPALRVVDVSGRTGP